MRQFQLAKEALGRGVSPTKPEVEVRPPYCCRPPVHSWLKLRSRVTLCFSLHNPRRTSACPSA
jgi:hypothetical protein